MIMSNLPDQPIFSLRSRSDAIADGELIDLTRYEPIRENWKYPLACDATVWNCIETAYCESTDNLTEILNNISERAQHKIAISGSADIVKFYAKVGEYFLRLKLELGTGDEHEPVLTLTYVENK